METTLTNDQKRKAYENAIATTRDALEGCELSLARRTGWDKHRAKARIADYKRDIAHFQSMIDAL